MEFGYIEEESFVLCAKKRLMDMKRSQNRWATNVFKLWYFGVYKNRDRVEIILELGLTYKVVEKTEIHDRIILLQLVKTTISSTNAGL